MIVDIDAKQIEWVGASWLSGDKVAKQEIMDGTDQHTDNQGRFKLPSRLIAKILLFRIIYGGSGYSFANDPEFRDIGSEKFWTKKIDLFYEKYEGLAKWHRDIVATVIKSGGRLELPTGRAYDYPIEFDFRGELKCRRAILNYPVQGLAADLVKIARISLYRRLKHLIPQGLLFVNSVHDSIMLDTPKDVFYNNDVLRTIYEVFDDVPKNFHRMFKVEFDLPVRCEVKAGPNWGNMEVIAI